MLELALPSVGDGAVSLLLHWLPTLLSATLFCLAVAIRNQDFRSDSAWRIAEGITSAGCVIAIGAISCVLLHQSHHAGVANTASSNTVGAVMQLLVSFIAWVIIRYSREYLRGDSGRTRYLVWLCITLAGIDLLVAQRNLLWFCLVWSLTSLGLQQLLLFYADRKDAVLAARKYFLANRIADVFCVAAVAVLYLSGHSLAFDALARDAQNGNAASASTSLAMLLLTAAVLLRSAQVPFHGWILQVMEAPTPVSALLHAGVVNIGGYLLLQLAPALDTCITARSALAIAGALTAAFAGIVMVTRVSIKVMLAWSTVAQMGFMLVEIGLGLYPLALLHLTAHSLYKAHAFLSASNSVREHRVLDQAKPLARARLFSSLIAVVLSLLLVFGVSAFGEHGHLPSWEDGLLASFIAIGMANLIDTAINARSWWRALAMTGLVFLFACGHFGLHQFYGAIIPSATQHLPELTVMPVAAILAALFLIQEYVQTQPDSQFATWLHPRAFAGFYLDEHFTLLTMRLWASFHRSQKNRTKTGQNLMEKRA